MPPFLTLFKFSAPLGAFPVSLKIERKIMNRVLITDAAGNLGCLLADYLKKANLFLNRLFTKRKSIQILRKYLMSISLK
jgi:hypothetical protein